MDVKEATRLVVDDYFALTGRPKATMTVEEYAKFFEIAKTNLTEIRKQSAENLPDSPPLQEIKYPVPERKHRNNQQETIPETEKRSVPEENPFVVPVPKAKGTLEKVDVLKFLQSVDS